MVQGSNGVLVSVTDLADREPRALRDGEVLDLGGRRVRWIDTPHGPHGWDAGLIYEEVTGILFTAYGRVAAKTESDIVGPAIDAEDASRASAITATTAYTVRNLETAHPCLMHGPAFTRDAAGAWGGLADDYERRLTAQVTGSE